MAVCLDVLRSSLLTILLANMEFAASKIRFVRGRKCGKGKNEKN